MSDLGITILLVTALLGVVLPWRIVVGHALFVGVVTLVLAQVLTLTISHIPFIRPYEPGHAKLRTRWPVYFFGLYVFAWWPAQVEVWVVQVLRPQFGTMTVLVALAVISVAALDVIGRRSATRWTVEEPEQSVDDAERLSVLDLGATPAK